MADIPLHVRVPAIVFGRRAYVASRMATASPRGPTREIDPGHGGRSCDARPSDVIVMPVTMWAGLSKRILGLLMQILVLAAMPSAALAAAPLGDWLTEDEDAALTITDCGGRLCGRIIWLESATDQGGSPRLDENNPDPAKQARRICGLVVIRGFERSGPDTWDGQVYNPQDGKTYSGSITVLPDGALQVRAYVGLPIFGRSQTWTRAQGPAADGMEYRCRSGG